MPSIETYRKQAKQLIRWHRERNYSIGGKVRLLERYRHLNDVEIRIPIGGRLRAARKDVVDCRRTAGRRLVFGRWAGVDGRLDW